MAFYLMLVFKFVKNKSLDSRPKLSVVPPTQHANQVQWSLINDIQKYIY